MAFTNHGYHISGTSFEGEPPEYAKCGGPGPCRKCNEECTLERIKFAGMEKMIPSGSDEGFNGETLFKVNEALKKSGLTDIQAFNAITEMQNAGILFRELIRSEG